MAENHTNPDTRDAEERRDFRADLHPEVAAIRERYARRDRAADAVRYSMLNPAVYLAVQEKERSLIRWIKQAGIAPLDRKTVLEIGCGGGGNLRQLLRLGFLPSNLVGNELLAERAEQAKMLLPQDIKMIVGDASVLELPDETFDVVLQSTVFSSILDVEFQSKLARRIWSLVRRGGGVLWYDFAFNNPRNSDVVGISAKRVKALFPEGKIQVWRVTLAPPIGRLVTRIHPNLYHAFNAVPLLRTHLLCWIQKV